jgi:hypothetical protein
MSSGSTRRDFLRVSGLGIEALAATSAAGDLHARNYEAGSTPGDAAVWVTDENQRLARASSISWRPVSGTDRDVIVLNPKVKCQEILGFVGLHRCCLLYVEPVA